MHVAEYADWPRPPRPACIPLLCLDDDNMPEEGGSDNTKWLPSILSSTTMSEYVSLLAESDNEDTSLSSTRLSDDDVFGKHLYLEYMCEEVLTSNTIIICFLSCFRIYTPNSSIINSHRAIHCSLNENSDLK